MKAIFPLLAPALAGRACCVLHYVREAAAGCFILEAVTDRLPPH